MIAICRHCHHHYLSTHNRCPHCEVSPTKVTNRVSMLAVILGLSLSGCGNKADERSDKPNDYAIDTATSDTETASPVDTAVSEPGDAPLYGVEAFDQDQDGWSVEEDCNDQDVNTYPGAAERDSTTACMTDVDNDGYGDTNVTSPVITGTDCDDNEPTVNPDIEEIPADGIDNNCNGEVDETIGDRYGVPN